MLTSRFCFFVNSVSGSNTYCGRSILREIHKQGKRFTSYYEVGGFYSCFAGGGEGGGVNTEGRAQQFADVFAQFAKNHKMPTFRR
jgi:hypothetical protein